MEPIEFDDATWSVWWREVSPAKKLSRQHRIKKLPFSDDCWFSLWEKDEPEEVVAP